MNSVVADIGCGTGLLAKLFCEADNRVVGIEPNQAMREAASSYLREYPNFTIADGRAEQTGLPDHAVDFLVAGQAAHWFEPAASRREFQRVLRPGGWIALVWNDRRYGPAPFMVAYEELMQHFGREYPHIKALWDHSRLAELFGQNNYRVAEFYNEQQLDGAGLAARILSASYMPARDDDAFPSLLRGIHRLFDSYQEQGIVRVEYDTRVFYSQLGT